MSPSRFLLYVSLWVNLAVTSSGGEAARLWERCGGSGERPVQCDEAEGLVCSYRLGSVLGEERTGLCEPRECEEVECPYRQICNLTSVVKRDAVPVVAKPQPQCVCPDYQCFKKKNLVCGYNGRSYKSVCELQKAECLLRGFIGIHHFGACKQPPPPPPCKHAEGHHARQLLSLTKTPCDPTYCRHKGMDLRFKLMPLYGPCEYRTCDVFTGKDVRVAIPGCLGYLPEKDFDVTKAPVPGGWSGWSDSIRCHNKDCSSVTVRRERTCTNPAPRNEGEGCRGSAVYTDARKCDGPCACVRRNMPKDYIISKRPGCHSLKRKRSHFCSGTCHNNSNNSSNNKSGGGGSDSCSVASVSCCQPVLETRAGKLRCEQDSNAVATSGGEFIDVEDCVCMSVSSPEEKARHCPV